MTTPNPLNQETQGFALISALWFAAILTVLSLTAAKTYFANTNLITDELRRIQLELLHDAALKYAVLTILEPQRKVAAGGIEHTKFTYQNKLSAVRIEVQNEAAFIDLLQADIATLELIFSNLNLSQKPIDALNQQRKKNWNQEQNHPPLNFRWLKKQLIRNEQEFDRALQYVTFYNGKARFNPYLASHDLLKALPGIQQTSLNRLIEQRSSRPNELMTVDRVSNPINHPLLGPRLSSYYRIKTSTTIGHTNSTKTRIIQIANNNNLPYRVVADL